jgi:hypothetical protein
MIYLMGAYLFLFLSAVCGISRGFESPLSLAYQLVFWLLLCTHEIITTINERKEAK